MSWERTEYEETAICACGKGIVVRRCYVEFDDWNRSRDGILSEKIFCDVCKNKYHIEHYIRHVFCPPWKGDGSIDRTYLVQNGLTIPQELKEKNFYFAFTEKIVATFSLEEIESAKRDMIQSKYSTRLTQQNSRDIVNLFYREYKKKSLSPIIDLLSNIEVQYQEYEWTPQRLAQFRLQEEVEMKKNQDSISDVLKQSFELDFRRK